MKKHLVVAIMVASTLYAQGRAKPSGATLTLYSPPRSMQSAIASRRPWASLLWVDHQRVMRIKMMPGHFLSLNLSNGSHTITGWTFSGHESDTSTPIFLEAGKRYFVRLVADSHVVLGFGGASYFGEVVTCEEARRDAAALEPIKLKYLTDAFLESVVRESYFPGCEGKRDDN